MTQHQLITMSGLPCSGTTTLARLLSKELNWQIIEAGARYRQEAKTLGQYEENTWLLDANRLRAIDQEMLDYVRTHQRVVWESRLSGWFAQGFPSSIRIWCSAHLEIRAARYAERENMDLSSATKRILEREDGEKHLFAHLYGVSCDFQSTHIYSTSILTDGTTEQTFQNLLNIIRDHA